MGEGKLREDAGFPGKFKVGSQDSEVRFLLSHGKATADPQRNWPEERPPGSLQAFNQVSGRSLLAHGYARPRKVKVRSMNFPVPLLRRTARSWSPRGPTFRAGT